MPFVGYSAKAQSAILRKSWMTFSLLKKCQWIYYRKRAETQLCHFLGASTDGAVIRAEVDKLLDTLFRHCSRWQDFEDSTLVAKQPGGEYFFTRPDGKFFSA